MKKLIPLLILLLIFALPAQADTAECGDYTYTLLPDGTAEIFAYTGDGGQVTVPDELDGHTVSAIGEVAFADCTTLTGVGLPDSVTSIGNLAFWNCTQLTALELPVSLTHIGDLAFWGCSQIPHVLIPDTVASVGVNPFMGCTSLTRISVSPEHPTLATVGGALFEKAGKLISYPAGLTEAAYAVPEGIRCIGNSALSLCPNLTEVTLPSTVTVVEDYAFSEAASLQKVTVPSGVVYIGASAFSACPALTEVTLPDTLAVLGDFAFAHCTSLTHLTLPDSLTTIGPDAFTGSDHLLVTVSPGSLAESFVRKSGVPYTYPDSTDWLTE